jgi:tRNA threonylcarbamoyladenosine biosynthesis protein TsaE
MKIRTDSPLKTKKIGALLAKEILEESSDRPIIIGLKGNLGSGKTTFVQGFAEGLGIKNRITSPTFVIFRKYDIPRHKLTTNGYSFFYHMDAYRIKNVSELIPLNFKEMVSVPRSVIVIEWPENINKALPKNTLQMEFQHSRKENERIIKFKQ